MKKVTVLSKAAESSYIAKAMDASVSKHLLDEHFTLVAANNRFYEMFGYDKEEYIRLYKNCVDVYYATYQEGWNELVSVVNTAIQNNEDEFTYIGRIEHKSGRKIWVKLVARFTDEYIDGCQVAYIIMIDISDLMQNKIEKDVIKTVFPGPISKYRVTKDRYDFLEGNEKFYEIFGNRKISFSHSDSFSDNAIGELKGKEYDLRKGDFTTFTVTHIDDDEKNHYFKVNAECVDWIEDDPIYLLLYTDITDLIIQQQKLEEYNQSIHKLAYSDEVTEGYNRRKFDQVALNAINNSKAGSYSMVWMNLQKFKLINDAGGIEAGDRVLKYIYEKIDLFLNPDEYVCRLFSDNFIILFKENDNMDIEKRILQMIYEMNSYNIGKKEKYYLTFVCGVYHIDDIGLSVTAMEDRAHTALKSNDSSRSELCVCNYYADEMRSKLINEKILENRMRDSLKNKEFEVYLQPKYSLDTKKIYGAEALIRWVHPTKGLLPPAEFIPLFERNGFIIELDLFVFEEVCALIKKWMDNGVEAHPISVNMSRAHFVKDDFLDRYIQIRDKYGVPAEYLEIELTETMVFSNPQAFSKIIREIHEAGFKCSMDDFGSGYSSLNMLKNLDLDTVKLDGAFFNSKTMEDKKENIIVKSIIDMTKALDMLTVAEGIESEKQMDFLNHTACDYVQGYIISKPLPIKEFEKLIR